MDVDVVLDMDVDLKVDMDMDMNIGTIMDNNSLNMDAREDSEIRS